MVQSKKKMSFSNSAWKVITAVDETVLVGWSETHGEVRGGAKTPTWPKTQGTSGNRLKTTRNRQRGDEVCLHNWAVGTQVRTIRARTDNRWHRWTSPKAGKPRRKEKNTEKKTRKKENHSEWQHLAGSRSEPRPRVEWNPIRAPEWHSEMKQRKLVHRPIKPRKTFTERSLVFSPLSMYLWTCKRKVNVKLIQRVKSIHPRINVQSPHNGWCQASKGSRASI